MKDDLSQKMNGNMMVSVYLIKMVFLFPTNLKLPLRQKKQRLPSPERKT